MKIESRDLTVDELLSGNYFFIPRFQRPYSWEEENILEFWKDINEVLGENYFIGSMVVYRSERNSLGVVDGQQRLTTIAILLCAIRDAFKDIGDDDNSAGLQQFIERRTRENKNKFVLETETSFPYLQEHILKVDEPELECEIGDEERAIELAESIFSRQIRIELSNFSDGSPEENLAAKRNWLIKLRDTVLDLNIILISLENEDNAYLIFETLNTRGKDLSLSDLLKNLFTKNIKEKGDVDHAKLKWANVLSTLADSDADLEPDTFIVHSWASKYEAVPVKQAFPKLKAAITPKTAHQYLNEFDRDARFYRSVFEPNFLWSRDERAASHSLAALRLFKVAQPAPGLLSLVRAYRDNKIKFGKIVEALEAIEKFHFSFTAVTSSRSSGGISGMYSSFGRRLYYAKDSNEAAVEIRQLINKLRERKPSSTEFSANFENIIYTKGQSKQRALVRYILVRIQELENMPHLGKDDDLTIEHLYPQSSINTHFPESIVGQLGNLLLIDKETNGALKDKNFREKKEILAKRGYVLPDMLMDTEIITPELIVSHTRRRAELAHGKVWDF